MTLHTQNVRQIEFPTCTIFHNNNKQMFTPYHSAANKALVTIQLQASCELINLKQKSLSIYVSKLLFWSSTDQLAKVRSATVIKEKNIFLQIKVERLLFTPFRGFI